MLEAEEGAAKHKAEREAKCEAKRETKREAQRKRKLEREAKRQYSHTEAESEVEPEETFGKEDRALFFGMIKVVGKPWNGETAAQRAAKHERSRCLGQVCLAGRYAPAGAASKDDAMQGRCEACPGGQLSAAGAAECTGTCPVGTFSSDGACRTCPAGSYCPKGIRSDCPAGTYQFLRGQSECKQCTVSDALRCPGGTGAITLDDRNVFCRSADCSARRAVLSRCQQGACDSWFDHATLSVVTRCAQGRDGPMCAGCDAASGYGNAGGNCVACPPASAEQAIVVLLPLLTVLGALFVIRQSLRPDFETATLTILRIFANYVQLSGMLLNFDLDWGGTVRWIVGTQRAVGGGAPPLLDCVGVSFVQVTIAVFAAPVVVPVFVALLLAGVRVFGVAPGHFFANGLLSVSYLVWPTYMGAILQTFGCRELAGASFVSSDVHTPCSGETYAVLRVTAGVSLAVAAALPLWLFAHLHRARAAGRLQGDRAFKARFFFLYGGFKASYYYWDAIVMLRKVVLLAVAVWLSDDRRGFQVWAGLWVLLVSFVLQLWHAPYHNTREDRLESLALGATAASLMLGQALLLGGDAGTEEAVRTVVGGLNLAVTAVFVWQLVAEQLTNRQRKREQRVVLGALFDGWRAQAAQAAAARQPLPKRRSSLVPMDNPLLARPRPRDSQPGHAAARAGAGAGGRVSVAALAARQLQLHRKPGQASAAAL
eukprot:g4703.t1